VLTTLFLEKSTYGQTSVLLNGIFCINLLEKKNKKEFYNQKPTVDKVQYVKLADLHLLQSSEIVSLPSSFYPENVQQCQVQSRRKRETS